MRFRNSDLRGKDMRTVYLGDSLTAGLPGVSYWRFLKNKSKHINRGVGGDTLLGAANRLQKILSSPRYDDVGQYVIEIGTNDVLLYTLKHRSRILRRIVATREKTHGCVPCKDINSFAANYEKLLTTLLEKGKKVGVIGLPVIETDIAAVNEMMVKYDAVIESLCEKYGIKYLSLRQLELSIKGDNNGTYTPGKSVWRSIADALFTTVLPFSMVISKRRGLAVTVDSTHLNKMTAKVFASAIEEAFL